MARAREGCLFYSDKVALIEYMISIHDEMGDIEESIPIYYLFDPTKDNDSSEVNGR